MNQLLKDKIQEAFSSVLPITLIVLFLVTLVVPLSLGIVAMFVVGAIFLVLGMGFFSLGADQAMLPIGEGVGTELSKSSKKWMGALVAFLMGFIVTIAEPDLQVLAQQVPTIPNLTLILTVAVGVGLFLVVAIMRIIKRIPLRTVLMFAYGLVFILSLFTPNSFVAVAFDSGGVTTGPITVPFMLSLGVGLAAMRGDKYSQADSFGFVALGSVGPILAVMVLGIVFKSGEGAYTPIVVQEVSTMQEVLHQFTTELPHYFKEVLMAIIPIFGFFLVFQLFTRRYKKRQIEKILVGLVYTLIGLVLFLTGVNVGFIPAGIMLGRELAATSFNWVLVPIGMLVGYFIVVAEPAIHVLNVQVEEVSGGAIPKKAMNTCLSIGVAVSVGLAMIRVLTGISIYWLLIPGYAIAIFMMFKVPPMYTGIAFDSGGVASGPMTTTFLLPFVMGACEALGGNVLTDAFGVVAMVAMTPLIAIQLMGILYKSKLQATQADEMDEMTLEFESLFEGTQEEGQINDASHAQ